MQQCWSSIQEAIQVGEGEIMKRPSCFLSIIAPEKRLLTWVLSLIVLFLLSHPTLGQQSCEQLSRVFTDQLDCCGSGSGLNRCSGGETAYSAAGCGVASSLCIPPEGMVTFRTQTSTVRSVSFYDLFTDTVTNTYAIQTQDNPGTSEGSSYSNGRLAYIEPDDPSVPGGLLKILEVSSGAITNTGQNAVGLTSLDGDLVAYSDPVSRSIRYYNIVTTAVVDTGIPADGSSLDNFPGISGNFIVSRDKIYNITTTAITTIPATDVRHAVIDGDLVAFASRGNIQFYSISSGMIGDTGVPLGLGLAVSGSKIAFGVRESNRNDNGVDMDLNGDRDQDDVVLHVYDTADSSLFNTGQIMPVNIHNQVMTSFEGDLVAHMLSEFNVSLGDFNEDGDRNDIYFAVYDLATNRSTIREVLPRWPGRGINANPVIMLERPYPSGPPSGPTVITVGEPLGLLLPADLPQ